MKLPSLVAILFMAAATQAFVGPIHPSSIETKSTSTELAAMSRRSALSITSGFLLGVHAAPKPSLARGTANPAFEDEVNFEPSQQARGEKIDINNAFVVRSFSCVCGFPNLEYYEPL
jgi:photosystem II PsbU protein